MAIAGGATTAYRCILVVGELQMGTSRMVGGSLCVKPEVALTILHSGESVIVAGADMVELRKLLAVQK